MGMKIAVIQHDITWADRDANFATLTPVIAQAANNGAQLIVLSEMFSTGFVVDRDDIGEPLGGPSSQFLSRMAKEHNVTICGSCPEIQDGDPRPFNSLVVAHPNGNCDRYSKIHPFTYGGEDKHFRAGDSFVTITVNDVRVSLFVCYDLRFANEFWALAENTDAYVIPANWPESRREHWTALLTSRAIENQAYVIGCNRIGSGGGLNYVGDSRVIDPLGKTIADAESRETIIYADIDAHTVTGIRQKFPFLQDRRNLI
jgi:predicted amidohydrolase